MRFTESGSYIFGLSSQAQQLVIKLSLRKKEDASNLSSSGRRALKQSLPLGFEKQTGGSDDAQTGSFGGAPRR